MQYAHNPPAVDAAVAGRELIKTKEVQRLLGANAWKIWVYLLGCRDKQGRTRVTSKRIAEARELSSSQTRLALRRLIKGGMVEWLGWQRSKRCEKAARVHRVLGDFRNGQISLPASTLKKLASLRHRGRPYVNSPPGAIVREEVLVPKRPKQSRAPQPNKAAHHSNKAAHHSEEKPRTTLTPGHEKQPEISRELDGGSDLLGKDIGKTNLSFPSEKKDDALRASCRKLSFQEVEEIARLRSEGGPIIPRQPTVSTLGVYHLPSPPLIPADASDLDAVMLAVKAYRGVYEWKLKEECFLFASGDVQESRHYRHLKDAVERMRDFDIAPCAWVPFTFEAWSRQTGTSARNKAPPITFALSAANIAKWCHWFRAQEASYSFGGKAQFNTLQKEVLSRYSAVISLRDRVLHQLERDGGLTVERAKDALTSLVAEWFPGGYADWVRRAHERGQDDKVRFKKQITEGEFVWK